MRVGLVGNPRAGGFGDRTDAVLDALRDAGTEVVTRLANGGDLTALARELAGECDVVAAMGGDGTVNAVATALAGTSKPMLVLPAGTLNHFARDLGVPRDLVAAALLVRDGVRRNVDVAEVNGRLFVNNSSIGAYPLAVTLRERLRVQGSSGKWRAMARASLRTLRRFPVLSVQIEADDGAIALETSFVFVGNNPYGTAGLPASRRGRLDSGRLGVLTAETRTRRQALRLALLAALNRLDGSPQIWRGEPSELTVDMEASSSLVALDGEVERLVTPLRYRSRPGELVVIAPAPA